MKVGKKACAVLLDRLCQTYAPPKLLVLVDSVLVHESSVLLYMLRVCRRMALRRSWRDGASRRQLVVSLLGRISIGIVGCDGRREVAVEASGSAMALLRGAVDVGGMS